MARESQIIRYQTYFVLFLVLYLAVSIFLFNFLSVLAIVPPLFIHFIYSRFYIQLPEVLTLFYISGFVLGIYNWVESTPIFIHLFHSVAFLECIRVIVVAILKYPKTIRDLQSLNEELEQRVQERTHELQITNEQLQQANQQLQELDRMKSAFVSQASHDLRTPLTAIKGSLDNLVMGIGGTLNEKQQRIIGRAVKSVDRLTHLINDILDLSRIESGRTVLEKKEISLRSLVENALQEHSASADKKCIALQRNLADGPCIAHVDPGKMERVIGELLNNAIKYTPENGTVNVQLLQENEHAIVQVSDTGIGMSPDECNRIWERFYRTVASQNMAKGSGLGLSIAKELIEMHKGSLQVESEIGKGTRFTIFIPKVNS